MEKIITDNMSTQSGHQSIQPMTNHIIEIRLVQPTDFLILEAFSNGQNYNAGAIAYRIQHDLDTEREVSKENINNRLPELEGYGFLEKIPAKGCSGLYHITEPGLIALRNEEKYNREGVNFLDLIERKLGGGES